MFMGTAIYTRPKMVKIIKGEVEAGSIDLKGEQFSPRVQLSVITIR
jgi:hypothetical protein